MSEKVKSSKLVFFISSSLFLSFIMKDLILLIKFDVLKVKMKNSFGNLSFFLLGEKGVLRKMIDPDKVNDLRWLRKLVELVYLVILLKLFDLII